MGLQIQELVSSIRKEGIEAAQIEADRMIAQAKEQAAAIIADAKAAAAQAEAKSQREIEVMKEGARVAVDHARRDAMLAFKGAVRSEFEKLLAADAAKTVQGDALAALIKAALLDEDPAAYAAEVSDVTEGLRSELAEQLRSGLELRISNSVKYGFRLAAKDGSGYFDCSDDAISEMLMPFFRKLDI